MLRLITRIHNKLVYYLHLVVGKVYDLLQKKNIIGVFPFTVFHSFGSSIRVVHSYPYNFIEDDKPLFNEWKAYDTFSLDLYLVNNVRVTHEGIVLKKKYTFIKALPHPIFRNQFGLLYNLFTNLFYKKKITHKEYVLIYDHWSKNNYYHWTIDSLCRLFLLKKHFNLNNVLLLPENCPGYILESVNKFGITNIELIPYNTYFEVQNLYVMNYAAWSGQQHPEVLTETRLFLLSAFKIDIINLNKRRIYVSRGKQKTRTIINEEDVIAVLKKYNFSIVYFEQMTMEEQILTMQQSEIFVSSHGANMTNLFFLNQNAKILELINNKKPNFCFWSLADSLKLMYNYQLCEIAKSDHIKVDIKKFEANILSLL